MEIGQVIRTYRKKKNMTQEDMAIRLGVTAPAVNKWENGNSMPDILLLAPIARLLGITVDELLSFREELTKEEINDFIRELDSRLKEEPFDQVFWRARKKVEEYPNCQMLMWQVAVVLNARLLFCETERRGEHEDYINTCFVRVLESNDEELRVKAAESLYGFWLRKEEYEKAQSYLAYMSDQNPEKKRKQGEIYGKMGQIQEAYKVYEELLFSAYGNLSLIFNSMYRLAVEKGEKERAHMLVEKERQAARLFDMGRYHEASAGLELAAAGKDQEATVEIMEEMLETVDDLCGYRHSPLYEHMTFKEVRKEFLEEIRKNLLANFRDKEAFGYMRENSRWRELTGEDIK